MNMISIQINKRIALFFFSIGTLLFLIQLTQQTISLVTVIGFYYLGLSIIINSIIVIILLVHLLINKNKKETVTSIGIILINFPIAIMYYFIVMNYILN